MFDLFYVGNDDSYWTDFKSKNPHAQLIKRSSTILIDCAKRSFTKMFWLVDIKSKIMLDCPFDFVPDKWDQSYIHLWQTKYRNEIIHDGTVALIPKTICNGKTSHPSMLPFTGNTKYVEKILSIDEKYEIFVVKQPDPRFKDWFKDFKERFTTARLVELTEDLFVDCSRLCQSEMFWLVPNVIDFNDEWKFDYWAQPYDRQYIHLWPIQLQSLGKDFISDLDTLNIQLWSRELANTCLGNQLITQDMQGHCKIFKQPAGIYTGKYDIFFVSYQEPNADENWKKLLKRFPYSKRIHGIKGIDKAHKECARLSATEMFWTVDGDTIVDDDWDFSYFPPIFDRTYTHVWYSRNPINHLRYGYGAVKLWPKNEVLLYNGSWLDYTTSVGKLKIFDQVIATTHFNSSPFETWKSAFRETTKLLDNIKKNPADIESSTRLKAWARSENKKEKFYHWSDRGAHDALVWHALEEKEINLINNFDYLKQFFIRMYPDMLQHKIKSISF
jgi:hypothetical protein